MIIRDPSGVERFGVGLLSDGDMIMGFDAPPGRGDDRNRERVNISADPEGNAQIRMLDRSTWVRARLALYPDNQVDLRFLDFPPGEKVERKFNIEGTQLERGPRK